MSLAEDTIAAVATPPGRGAVSIVRVSGPGVPDIARAVLGQLPSPRRAVFLSFVDEEGNAIDQGIALYFAEPGSFTGEAVLELHGHGGPVVTDLVLARVLSLGARLAEPGEFSRRAFLNDKLDLTQAEAIADLIDSGSAQAARAAMRSLRGEFSHRVQEIVEALTHVRLYIEAAIDFPEEEIDFLSDGAAALQVQRIIELFDDLERTVGQGCLLQEGMTIVIAGRPNAGKSSLLNRLAGYEAAIVTEIPGTTRDVVRERIDLDGMPLHVLDTAGLRVDGDVVEQEGMRRTRAEMARADRVLLVIDSSDADQSPVAELPPDVPVTVLRNKIDLSGESAGLAMTADPPTLGVSARTGEGIGDLKAHLEACVGFHGSDAATLSARRRHLDALRRARACVEEAENQIEAGAGELAAEELRLAQQALGEITGEFTNDDLLGRIFASFCIGK